jgi:hypothetical protein
MGGRKNLVQNDPNLFEEQERQQQYITRRLRRQRALIIPRFLREPASKLPLTDPAREGAYQVALRWAS